jgi:hypothetical protein
MQNRNNLLGLLAAIALGAVIAFGFQAFTGTAQQADPVATEEVAVPFEEMEEVTIEVSETAEPTPAPMDIEVIDEPATQGEDDDLLIPEEPTSEPVPPAPQPVDLAAGDQVIFSETFADNSALDTWRFAQVYDEPNEAPAWEVWENDLVQQVLVSPDDRNGLYFGNDTLAIAPVQLSGDGVVDVSARLHSGSKVGIVLGYEDAQNFVAMIFGADIAVGIGGQGVNLVQVVDGEATVLAFNDDVVLEYGRWYSLRLEVAGQEVRASVDGGKPVVFALTTPLPGASVGLYAGFEGYAFFDNMRVTQK